MLDALRKRVKTWLDGPAAGSSNRIVRRSYAGARQSRLTTGFGSSSNSSADTELALNLTQLRARSRQLMRDAPYAKRARTIVVNNVIGSGVGLQAQVSNTRGGLNERVNADIEEAWRLWSCADSCHTGGSLCFADVERAALAEVFTAGEVFLRMHSRAFGDSRVPLGLELIEAERVADEMSHPQGVPSNVRMGVELDEFQRPLAYWIRDQHPGELRFTVGTNRFVRVPADQIIHLRIIDRWPQTRGEPWLHSVLRRLNDMDEYSSSEVVAARMSANYFATIRSPDDDPLGGAEVQDDGSKQLQIEPGVIEQLAPGDILDFHSPNRPNAALDPFMRYMLREVAAGVGVSYESLSRDYSQSNYSSSRLALLDDRDLWRVLQQWWCRSFRERIHAAWLQAAVLSRAITSIPVDSYALNMEWYRAARFKFRGWSWVDPTKEVDAFEKAVRCGFTTVSAVVAQTGGGVDIEDVIAERKRELEMFDAAGIDLDTTVEEPVAPAQPSSPQPQDDGEDGARIRRVV